MPNEKMERYMEITRHNIDFFCCAVCGANLVQPWDGKQDKVITCCAKDRAHSGIIKKQDPTVKTLEGLGEAGEQAIEKYESVKGEQKTMKEATAEKQTALAKYETKMQLTQADVTDIVTTLWPTAPQVEIKKAIMLCVQYKLNPLAKHIYLIPFKNQSGQYDWSLIWGIEATRLVARRAARKHKISYGYLDFSPRSMTEAEQIKINGKMDDSKYWALTILRDDKGNQSFGVGFWPKDKAVKGADKGNSPENMARIRSERNALNRLLPGELPGEEEVQLEDGTYLPSLQNGNTIEAEVTEVPEDVSPPSEEETTGQTETISYDVNHKWKNIGEMFTVCQQYGIGRPEIYGAIGVSEKTILIPDKAWPLVYEKLIKPKLGM